MAEGVRDSFCQDWLEFLKIGDCTCEFAWESLGRLYNVDMGKGWIRTTTEKECPHHGEKAEKGKMKRV
jgi:hypothetical protein